MSDKSMLEKQIADLDRRVHVLEEALREMVWDRGEETVITHDLMKKHGEYVDKMTASKILGVTRATIYTMLSDGRIEGACGGRKVSVKSIARYMAAPKTPGKGGKRENTESVD